MASTLEAPALDPARELAVQVAQHVWDSREAFRAVSLLQQLAHRIITADPPGLTTLEVQVFDRVRTPRPRWPLDPDAHYIPSASAAAALA